MISRVSECKQCFSKEICSLAAISLEEKVERKEPVGQFKVFAEIQQKATAKVKEYFKKFIECISLEQSSEIDRQSSSYTSNMNKETDLQIVKINPNGERGVIVVL